MLDANVDAIVDAIMRTDTLNIKGLPDGIERKMYGATIGIVYRFLMHAVGNIHGVPILSR